MRVALPLCSREGKGISFGFCLPQPTPPLSVFYTSVLKFYLPVYKYEIRIPTLTYNQIRIARYCTLRKKKGTTNLAAKRPYARPSSGSMN